MHPATRLQLEMSEADRELLVSLLERERGELPHAIHHTDTMSMRRGLERRLEQVEALLERISQK